jgi:hypothetical protein
MASLRARRAASCAGEASARRNGAASCGRPFRPAGARPANRSRIRPGRGAHVAGQGSALFPPTCLPKGVGVQPVSVMVAPLTYRVIRLILDRNEELTGSGPTLPATVVQALAMSLRGRLIGTDSYRVTLTQEDATILMAWCREVAEGSNPRDGAILRVTAAVIEAAS